MAADLGLPVPLLSVFCYLYHISGCYLEHEVLLAWSGVDFDLPSTLDLAM
jgi:hypothetical protein